MIFLLVAAGTLTPVVRVSMDSMVAKFVAFAVYADGTLFDNVEREVPLLAKLQPSEMEDVRAVLGPLDGLPHVTSVKLHTSEPGRWCIDRPARRSVCVSGDLNPPDRRKPPDGGPPPPPHMDFWGGTPNEGVPPPFMAALRRFYELTRRIQGVDVSYRSRPYIAERSVARRPSRADRGENQVTLS
jgi:hypothetical protein